MSHAAPLLSVRNLCTYFGSEDGVVKAVDGVSFDLERGETLGVVGESGSGKSVLSLSLIRLIPEPPGKILRGEIVFDGQDILSLPLSAVRRIRGKRISMIFQDPMTSLNPFMRVSSQLMEITQLHLQHTKLVLRRDAAARDDRDGALVSARTLNRRRAHDRARRDDSSADSRTHQEFEK
jgi:oligopeptide transport system ATP-binding protein